MGPALNEQLLSVSETFTLTLDFSGDRPLPGQAPVPLLLDPRNTVVTETQPTFHWQPVPGAALYRLSLTLPGGQSWSRESTGTTLPYPAGESPLTPGRANIVLLEALGEKNIVDETILQVLDEAGLAALAEAETAIRTLDVDEAAQGYLLAQLYREQGMSSAAIARLERLADSQGVTSAYLARQLGDLYLEIESYDRAEEQYRAALAAAETGQDKSAQAAAHFGLAHTALAQGQTKQALDFLNTAEALYRQTGETERAEMAAAARVKLE